MPTVPVSSDEREVAAHVDLTAGAEPTRVVFDSRTIYSVELINRGDGGVWYSTDGSAPTVGGQRCYYLPAQANDVRRVTVIPWVEGDVTVALLAEANTAVSVQRVS